MDDCFNVSDEYRDVDDKYHDVDDECCDVDDEYRDVDDEYHDVDDEYHDVDDKYRDVDDEYRDVDDECCDIHRQLSRVLRFALMSRNMRKMVSILAHAQNRQSIALAGQGYFVLDIINRPELKFRANSPSPLKWTKSLY